MRALRHGSAEGGSAAVREAALGQATARLDAVQPGAAGLLGEALRDEPMLSHVIDGLRGPRLVSAMRAGMDRARSSPSMRTGRRMETWAAALDHLCATAERHGLGEGQSRNQMLGQLAGTGSRSSRRSWSRAEGNTARSRLRSRRCSPESLGKNGQGLRQESLRVLLQSCEDRQQLDDVETPRAEFVLADEGRRLVGPVAPGAGRPVAGRRPTRATGPGKLRSGPIRPRLAFLHEQAEAPPSWAQSRNGVEYGQEPLPVSVQRGA